MLVRGTLSAVELWFLGSSVTKHPKAAVVQHDTIFRTSAEGHGCSEAVEALPAALWSHITNLAKHWLFNQPFADKPFG